jgi:hypothetical protein
MPQASPPGDVAAPQPRSLDRVRHKIRLKHCSIRTQSTYVDWVHRCGHFQGLRQASYSRSAGRREPLHGLRGRDGGLPGG